MSNVLNAPERVADHTSARVHAAITALGYRPDRAARNLRARTSKLLGYGVASAGSGESNLLLDRFLAALVAAASDEGYGVLLFSADEAGDAVAAHAELVATGTVDAFVLSATNYRDERAEYLTDAGIPFVTFGRTAHRPAHDWVDVDGAVGTRSAVAHLVQRGHRRIAFVGWPSGSVTGDERARGWHQGLAAAGLDVDPQLELRVTNSGASGRAALDVLADLQHPPSAVVTVSDLLAVGIAGAALRRGLAVPEDLAIVGFDDTPMARLLDPPLTSVRQPLETAARHIAARLTAQLAGGPAGAGLLLRPELIVRDTS